MKNTYSFRWDWKEQPNFTKMFKVIQMFSENNLTPYHYLIETGSDDYGLLITCDNTLSNDEAKNRWELLEYNED